MFSGAAIIGGGGALLSGGPLSTAFYRLGLSAASTD